MDTQINSGSQGASQALPSEIHGYRIIERLGGGGMADVYRVEHIELGVKRALKVIKPHFAANASDAASRDQFQALFRQEAQAVAGLEHPNIVRVYDFGQQDALYFMVMQLINGEDLRQILQRRRTLEASLAVRVIVDVAGAVDYAHDMQLIHRDIKPDNIMLTSDGVPVLTDFGIAKINPLGDNPTTSTAMGTPGYMPPEQSQGARIDKSADIYALAVTLFELLTGEQPTAVGSAEALAKTMAERNPQVGKHLLQVIFAALSPAPQDRPRSARLFAEQLQAGMQRDDARTGIIAWRPILAAGALLIGGIVAGGWYLGVGSDAERAPLAQNSQSGQESQPVSVVETVSSQPGPKVPGSKVPGSKAPDRKQLGSIQPSSLPPSRSVAAAAVAPPKPAPAAAPAAAPEAAPEVETVSPETLARRAWEAAEAKRLTGAVRIGGSFEDTPPWGLTFRMTALSAEAISMLKLEEGDLLRLVDDAPLPAVSTLRDIVQAAQPAHLQGQTVAQGALVEYLLARPLDTSSGQVRFTLVRGDERRDLYCRNFAMIISCR